MEHRVLGAHDDCPVHLVGDLDVCLPGAEHFGLDATTLRGPDELDLACLDQDETWAGMGVPSSGAG